MAAAAARRSIRVTVLAPDHREYATEEKVDPANIEVLRFPANVFHFRHLWRLQAMVSPVLRRQSWDIVHAADWPMILAVGRRRASTARHIASFHGSDIGVLKYSKLARLSCSAARIKRFDRYVCNSKYTAGLLTRAFPELQRTNIAVAPLGVDLSWFSAPTESAVSELKQQMNYQETDLVILTVARIDARKGHLKTIEALARLPSPIKERIKYICVGLKLDPVLIQSIVNTARSLGVRIVVTGVLPASQVRAAYSLAKVFALTVEPMEKKIEGFGLVLLEAAAAGLPAVVTAVHAIPEVVRDGCTGWICPPNDLPAITAAFEDAVGKTHHEMSEACVHRARASTWDLCAELTYRDTAT